MAVTAVPAVITLERLDLLKLTLHVTTFADSGSPRTQALVPAWTVTLPIDGGVTLLNVAFKSQAPAVSLR